MRYYELTEAFGTPLAYQWEYQDKYRWEASFRLDQFQYGLAISNDTTAKRWHIQYWQRTRGGRMTHRNTNNVGSKTMRVLATVVAAIKDFITTVRPTDELVFSADKEVGSKMGRDRAATADRDTVYSRMLGRMWGEINDLGYRVKASGESRYGIDYHIMPKAAAPVSQAVTEATAKPLADRLLLIVHPGSCCGSADFNIGDTAEDERDVLVEEIHAWTGPALVVVDDHAKELSRRRYAGLGTAIASKHPEKVAGDAETPDWVETATAAVQRLAAPRATIAITGAWNGIGGCCNAMEEALSAVGYKASILPGALRSED